MRRPHRAPAWYRPVLRHALPDPGEVALLRAALGSGAGALQAMEQASPLLDVLADAQRRDAPDAKYLVPLLAAAQARTGAMMTPAVRTMLRMGLLREELRASRFREIRATVTTALEAAAVGHAVTGGAATMDTLYSDLGPRHAHGIDLLVTAAELPRAHDALVAAGLTIEQDTPGRTVVLRHPTGVPVRARALLSPWLPAADLPALLARARRIAHGTEILAVPAVADALVDTCLLLLDPAWRDGTLWACDAHLMVAAHPDLDWDSVLAVADAMRAGAYLFEGLWFLAEALNTPVPPGVLEALQARAADSGPAGCDAVLARLHGERGWHAVWGGPGPVPVRWRIARQLLVPSADYMRHTRPVPHDLLLPWLYSVRAGRFLWRALRSGR